MSQSYFNSPLQIGEITCNNSQNLDPSHVVTIDEAICLRYLLSPLLMFNEKLELIPVLAENFYSDGKELKFYFNKKSKTVVGDYITASDAYYTFKRLLILSKNTHGSLKSFLCPNQTIIKLDDPCPGIRIESGKTPEEDVLVLTPYKKHFLQHLLPTLASVDYLILSKKAIDPITLKIKNWKDSTGPYSIKNEIEGKEVHFYANENHPFYSKEIPQEIKLITKYQEGMQMLDVISSKILSTQQHLSRYEKEIQSGMLNLNFTHNLRYLGVRFSPTFIKKSTPLERIKIAQEFFDSEVVEPLINEKPSLQYFHDYSEGHLSEEQIKEIQNLRENARLTNIKNKVVVGVFSPLENRYDEKLFSKHSWAIKKVYKNHPMTLSEDDDLPDMFTISGDISFHSSLSMIAFQILRGNFGQTRKEGNIWIEKFLAEESVEKRINMIQELHFNALKLGHIYMHSKSPFSFLSKKNITLKINPYFSILNPWEIRKNDSMAH